VRSRPDLWFLRVLAVATLAASLALVVAGTRLLHEGNASGLPDRVQFEGRDFHRGRTLHLPAEAVESGRTTSGETVYKPAGEVGLSVVIWVTGHDETRAFALVGGP
jgi:hypothetical protein